MKVVAFLTAIAGLVLLADHRVQAINYPDVVNLKDCLRRNGGDYSKCGWAGKRAVAPLETLKKCILANRRNPSVCVIKPLTSRSLVSNILSKFKDNFVNAIKKFKTVTAKWSAKIGTLKDTKEVEASIDKIVSEHKEEHKRFVMGLFEKGKNMLSTFLSGIHEKVSNLVGGVLSSAANLVVGKRATLGDHLQRIGGVISKAVSPFKDLVAGLGNTLKGHFSNLVDAVKGHVNVLKGKLSGHVDDLKTHGKTLLEHGKNALGALSETVTDILKQTVNNAQPAIQGIVKTASDAADKIVNGY